VIFTIGHSTRTADAFVDLLRTHGVRQVVDVRTVPRSSRHPHFGGDALARILAAHGLAYHHFPDLGGLRRPRADSRNTGWRHPAFRGYADHMETPAFGRALDSLVSLGAAAPTAAMCAEAVWWQCHRRLLADALVARGVPVAHILSTAPPKAHEMSGFARIEGGALSYPGLL
jgi:uncharacterized protein (DUF488 family)